MGNIPKLIWNLRRFLDSQAILSKGNKAEATSMYGIHFTAEITKAT